MLTAQYCWLENGYKALLNIRELTNELSSAFMNVDTAGRCNHNAFNCMQHQKLELFVAIDSCLFEKAA